MEKIIVLGHKNPDVDSIVSGYLLTSYLRYKRYDAEYVIPDDKVDDEVRSVLDKVGIDVNSFSNNVHSCAKLILVDHHETTFDNEVVAIIDHHPTIKAYDCKYYLNKPSSSTTIHIYNIIKKESPNYISRRFVELVLIGAAVDTCSFRTAKAIQEEKDWFFDMCEKYDISSQEILSMGDFVTDISDLDKASVHGYKGFKYGNKSVGTSFIQVNSIGEGDIDLILDKIKIKVREENLYMWAFIFINLKTSTSKVYKVIGDDVIIEEYDFIVSRALNVMPNIERKILNKEI